MRDRPAVAEVKGTARRRFARFGRTDCDRVFRAASRHSRRVRLLRWAIPGAVAGSVAGAVIFTTITNPLRLLAKVPIDIGSLVVSGSKIMMQQPRLAGFTRDNRRYDVTAQVAGQDLTKPDFVELQGIRANMQMQNNVLYQSTARSGVYNSKADQLTLNDEIIVTSSAGQRARLSEAVIDISAGKLTSEKPVEITGEGWSVNSNQMEVSDSGDVIRFDRGVTVVLQPENTGPVASAGVGAR